MPNLNATNLIDTVRRYADDVLERCAGCVQSSLKSYKASADLRFK